MMSMTGFGQASFAIDSWVFAVEARSVNNRFIDVRVHLPWSEPPLESRLRELVRQRLARGRVDLTVRLQQSDSAAGETVMLNLPAARSLARALQQLSDIIGAQDLRVAAALITPQRELLVPVAPGAEHKAQIEKRLVESAERALEQLLAMREREGEAARGDIESHIDELEQAKASIAEATQLAPAELARKLEQRLGRLVSDHVEPARLAQEAALLADRCDVSEELARLQSHIGQLRSMIDEVVPVGRKLEFMLQETNREFNTIASKTISADVSRMVVEAKSCLEKMREQAQNVE